MRTTAPPRHRPTSRPAHLGGAASPRRAGIPVAATPAPSDGRRSDLPPLLAALALAATLTTALPARAWDHPHHGFKEGARPRRHTRPMWSWDRWSGAAEKVGAKARARRVRWADEEAAAAAPSTPVAKVEAAMDAALDTAEAGVRGAGAALVRASRSAARALGVEVAGPGGTRGQVGGGGGPKKKKAAPAPLLEALSISADRPASRLVAPAHLSSYSSRLAARTPLTDSEFATSAWVVGGVGTLALLALARRSGWFSGSRRRRGPGKWVRDRSLGGRMVWVEDGAGGGAAAFSRAPRFEGDDGTGAPAPRGAASYGPDFFDFEGAEGSRARAAVPKVPAHPPHPSALPAWWDAPPKDPPLSASRGPTTLAGDPLAASAAATARAALSRLTNAKAGGADYSLVDLVALRLALAGTRVALSPTTPSIRDAIFRAAAGEAAAAAARGDGAAALGGASPAAFIAGLAADLTLPPSAAANMASGAVAALARSLLVDALAAQRDAAASGGPEPVLARLACLLAALPFTPGAPQPPMVAAALAGRGRPEELARLGKAAAGLDPETAGAVAELLGL